MTQLGFTKEEIKNFLTICINYINTGQAAFKVWSTAGGIVDFSFLPFSVFE